MWYRKTKQWTSRNSLLIAIFYSWICIASTVTGLKDIDHHTILPRECLDYGSAKSIWRYKYCHLDHVEQYLVHPVSGNLPLKHHLGKWNSASSTSFSRIGDSLIYTYLGGDSCGTSTTNRMTMARVSCSGSCGNKHAKALISSISEPSTCVYVIDICAPSLCSSITTNRKQDFTAGATDSKKSSQTSQKFSQNDREQALDRLKSIFYHSYEAYLEHAYPYDELRPLSCVGTNTDLTPGGMLTLIDALDTLAAIGNVTEFKRVVNILSSREQDFFKIDKKVSVFETTIRILGGLLSAHLLCEDPQLHLAPDGYDGSLLRMAKDLGDRLLPAFETSTTVPYGTVHLLKGVPFGETTEACTAAAGSLSIEFGMLSVLTGDPKYGRAARSSLKTIFDLRSSLNLIGRHLDINSGHWTEAVAGIGSNIDSIYEYYLKQYILFGDDESLEWFEVLYEGVLRHLRLPAEAGGKRFYHELDMKSGQVVRRYFSALQAFWPGVQILAGDVSAAAKSLNGFLAVWDSTSFLPEDFDLVRWATVRGGSHAAYLLRPELAESVFYTYHATKDESWLLAGKEMIDSVHSHCLVPNCGFASIKDVDTKQQMDFMPSFFLSEWIKYLYLLFDEQNFLNQGNWVFSTEAHPFRVSNWTQNNPFLFTHSTSKTKSERKKRFSRSGTDGLEDVPSLINDDDVCQDYHEPTPNVESYFKSNPGWTNQMLRPFDTAGMGSGTGPSAQDVAVSEKKVSGYLQGVGMFEIISTSNSFIVHRLDKNQRLIISNLDSTTGMISTNDGKPPVFIALANNKQMKTKAGTIRYANFLPDFMIGSTCYVHVSANDLCPALLQFLTDKKHAVEKKTSYRKVHFEPVSPDSSIIHKSSCAVGDGFGVPPWYAYSTDFQQPLPVVSIPSAVHLCDSEVNSPKYKWSVPSHIKGPYYIHAKRGECSFEEKAQNAYSIGAIGVIVSLIDSKDEPFIMAHVWNGTSNSWKPSTTPVLVRQEAGKLIQTLQTRAVANPKVQVDFSPDTRVVSEHGRVIVSAFDEWQAVFGPLDEHGVYKLSLVSLHAPVAPEK